MRVAINARFLLKDRLEGIGRYTFEVIKYWLDTWPEDELILFFDRAYAEEFLFDGRITPVVCHPQARHPALWYVWFEITLPYYLKKYRADVFLSMDGYCSLRSRVPSVMVLHDLAYLHYPHQVGRAALWYYRQFVPRYLHRADRIVTVATFGKQDMLQWFPTLQADTIHVSCNGISPAFQPLSDSVQLAVRDKFAQGCPYFFYLGAMHPRKNIPRLIRAFDAFKTQHNTPCKLLLAGRMAWQTGEIHDAYNSAANQTDIHFLGYVDDATLPQLVGSAVALTYVSLFEGFGVPLLEAMQAGTPVISSNVSSMPEVAGEAALLVDPQDTASITNALSQVYFDDDLRQALRQKGFVQCQNYSWPKAARAVRDAVEALHISS